MRKALLLMAVLLCTATMRAQICAPVNCIASLPAYGGICDTNLAVGRVNVAYSDFESFVVTSSCFDAGIISPGNAGTNIRILNVDNFTYANLPAGIAGATNANAYSPPNPGNIAGCIRFQGTPTQIGVFRNTVSFLADIRLCSFPFLTLNDNAASYNARLIILPNPNFTGLASSYCTTSGPVTLTVTGTTGGVFSGPGISGNTFNPATAGPGTHTIKYKVTRQEGAAIAPASDSLSVTVTVTAPSFTYYVDSDGDGYGTSSSISSCQATPPAGYAAQTDDCNDSNAAINPGAAEICDGIDNNCAGGIDNGLTFTTYYLDNDNDGYGTSTSISSCQPTPPAGYATQTGDCNDGNAAINPGATEICDGVDNNCAGGIDNGLTFTTYYLDTDGDNYGSSTSISSCQPTAPNGYVVQSGDCDDTNPAINPGATEICDGVDNNCAGGIDNGLTFTTYYLDNDNDGYGSSASISSCQPTAPSGYVTQSGDCNDNNPAVNPGVTEICDGVDNNCAGGIDNGLTFTTYYVDNDGDGYGTTTSISSCQPTPPAGYAANNTDCDDGDDNINPGELEIPGNGVDENCDGSLGAVDADNDGFDSTQDCDDNNDAVYPNAPELCDGIDNNCVGGIDEGLTLNTYYFDADNDGYGSNTSISTCQPTPPTGYVANNTDCNDANANINPAATEVCDGIDNNCAGGIDEGLTLNTYYIDADNDGYGNAANSIVSCAANAPNGYVAIAGDCNDANANINPGATEVCDGIDNNCAGGIDDGLTQNTYYIDADNDGYGNPTNSIVSCAVNAPNGYVAQGGDCNDANANINPGATEVCDGVDNNCVGGIDEGLALNTYYVDADNDSYGSPVGAITSCAANPPNGYVTNNTDCNDANANINPGSTEVCDGTDNNCNNSTDEGLLNTYYVDSDNDGYGSTVSISSCLANPPSGYVINNTDCNDNNAAINPGATEVCDGIDNNCAGGIDDGLTLNTYYLDTDADGYGSATTISSCAVAAPNGYANQGGDCDDGDATVYPGATELCDGKDNDCANGIDDGLTTNTYYLDADNDGYGTTGIDSVTCSVNTPLGYVSISGDCDDNNADIYPGNAEVCDGLDNDCANGPDDGLVFSTYYRDLDGDNFGNPNDTIVSCDQSTPVGYVSSFTDCDDTNPAIRPGGTEIPNNSIDEDCNGSDLTIGLTTVEAQFGIKVFPNPANEYVVLSGKLNDNLTVIVYDLQGKQLLTRNMAQTANYVLDLSSLKAGYYMLEVTNKTNGQRGFSRIAVVK